jgi:hypothetical protein
LKKKIYKYEFDWNNETIALPKGAHILRAELQNNEPYLWAVVDPDQPEVQRQINVYGTGWDILEESGIYINTVFDGPYVWHFFDKGEVNG